MTNLQDLLNGNDNRGRDVIDFEDWFYRRKRMKRFWECYVEGTNGGRHYKHFELPLAEKEAERLATLPNNQGKTVYLFECIGKCRIEPFRVKWEVTR